MSIEMPEERTPEELERSRLLEEAEQSGKAVLPGEDLERIRMEDEEKARIEREKQKKAEEPALDVLVKEFGEEISQSLDRKHEEDKAKAKIEEQKKH